MKTQKINILGSVWTIKEYSKTGLQVCGESMDGCTMSTSRTIAIYANNDVDSPEVNRRQTLRHEIMHAYLFESGLGHNFEGVKSGHSELLVD